MASTSAQARSKIFFDGVKLGEVNNVHRKALCQKNHQL